MTTDKEHLDFIYHRLAFMHLENPNVDYMLRFRKIIDSMPSGTGIGVRRWNCNKSGDVLTPEHSARPYGGDNFPEVEAAYGYVDSVVQHADAISSTGIDTVPAWHGWALREAFLAGCSHVHSNGSYIVPAVGEEVPSSRANFDAAYLQGMKDGATAAVLAIVSTLEKSWAMRLAMRITPLTVLRKVAEGLPAAVDQLPPG